MTDAPERIWMHEKELPQFTLPASMWVLPQRAVEYIRADLAPSADKVAELVEALRKIADPKRSAMFNVREIARAALAKLEADISAWNRRALPATDAHQVVSQKHPFEAEARRALENGDVMGWINSLPMPKAAPTTDARADALREAAAVAQKAADESDDPQDVVRAILTLIEKDTK